MAKAIDLSIVIVSFNTKEIIENCIRSIFEQTSGITFEVIVVDNASKDGSVEALTNLEAKNNNLKVIRSFENLGFGIGNNLGAKEAKGEYLLFLNSDTLLTENNLPHCLEEMKKDEKIGVYSCNLINSDGTHQPSGGYFPNLSRLISWQLFFEDLPLVGKYFSSIHPHTEDFLFLDKLIGKKKYKKFVSSNKKNTYDWVTGAFMIIPTKIFREVGGFDEKIFMYTEELELCYRIKKLGMTVLIDNHTSIVHLGGASGGSYLALTKEVEGMLYFWQKHYPRQSLLLVRALFFIGSLLRLVIFGIIKANATHRKSYWEILRLVS